VESSEQCGWKLNYTRISIRWPHLTFRYLTYAYVYIRVYYSMYKLRVYIRIWLTWSNIMYYVILTRMWKHVGRTQIDPYTLNHRSFFLLLCSFIILYAKYYYYTAISEVLPLVFESAKVWLTKWIKYSHKFTPMAVLSLIAFRVINVIARSYLPT